MPFTNDDKRWHTVYENLDTDTREAIEDAFDSVVHDLRSCGLVSKMDHTAEILIAAITRFVVCSNPDIKVNP